MRQQIFSLRYKRITKRKYKSKSGEVLSAYYGWDGVGRVNAKMRVSSGKAAINSVLRVGRKWNCECIIASEFWGRLKETDMSGMYSGEKRSWVHQKRWQQDYLLLIPLI